MTTTDIIITIHRVGGAPCAGASAATINAALNGAQPLTLNRGKVAGDVVWLAPRVDIVWGDGITTRRTDIAATTTHPEFGQLVWAYIDVTRLDQAPQLAAAETAARRRARDAYSAVERGARGAVPNCDNCGNCAACC